MRVSNTEVTVIWVLAVLLGALLYHFFFGRRGDGGHGKWQAKWQAVEKELTEEKARQIKLKQQLEGAHAKANSYASSMSELDKLKARIQELHKEVETANRTADRYKADYEGEHSKVTSMIVEHSDAEAMKNRVKNQEKELARSRDEIARIRAELDAALAERARMAKSLDESQVVEMRNKIQRLESDLQSSRLMVIKYQSDSSRMQEEGARQRQMEELTKELEGLRERNAKAEEELKTFRTRITEAAALKLDMEKLQVALRESGEKLASEVQSVAEARARISALEAELASLRISADRQTAEPVREAAPASSAAAVPTPVPDDLKRVEGIGPKLEQMLNEHGIYTFAGLAATPVDELRAILEKGGDAFRIHDPGTWPQQGGLLAEGRIAEFEALTERLKGGRDMG